MVYIPQLDIYHSLYLYKVKNELGKSLSYIHQLQTMARKHYETIHKSYITYAFTI